MTNCRTLLIAPLMLLALSGCDDKPGSAGWCEHKSGQSKSEWTMEDATTYARHCVLDSTTIGSESWCDDLSEKDKADWTSAEAADYARHCVL